MMLQSKMLFKNPILWFWHGDPRIVLKSEKHSFSVFSGRQSIRPYLRPECIPLEDGMRGSFSRNRQFLALYRVRLRHNELIQRLFKIARCFMFDPA